MELTSGSLKASTDYINGRGPNLRNPGESTVRGFLYYKDQLNDFAQTLANVANSVIPEDDGNGQPKLDANGNIIYKQLLGAMNDLPNTDGSYSVVQGVPVTADNISVTDQWANNSGYVIFQRNPDANDTADNVGNYALALADAITNSSHRFEPNGAEFDGTFLDYVKNYVTTLGEDTNFAEGRLTATSNIQRNLEDNRDSVSGVVVDEEVSNMMLYNKSLSAASRLMTAMDEALDTIINKTGMVGR